MTGYITKSFKNATPNMLGVQDTDKRLTELLREGWPKSFSIHGRPITKRSKYSDKKAA